MATTVIIMLIAFACLALGIVTGVAVGKRTSRKLEETLLANMYEGGSAGYFNAVAKLSRSLPIPSDDLIKLVTPPFDAAQFLRSGGDVMRLLCGLLRINGLPPESLRSVLDFGCGCGRVLRHFPVLGIKNLQLHGTDYNPVLIDWCKQNLPIADFHVNNLEPPLIYGNQAFDFVFAISVFTHFTEPLQFAWLDEMARILAPRGHLLVTLHGEAFMLDLDEEEKQQFQSGQLVVKNVERMGENICGAYHPVQYVKDKFTRSFDIVQIIQQEQPRWQDVYLLRRKHTLA